MVVLNKENNEVEIDLAQYAEIIDKGVKAREVISGATLTLNDKLLIGARQPMILEIQQ